MSRARFQEGDDVLCFHGPKIYQAKLGSVATREDPETGIKTPHYLTHYQGWHKRWDEWVPETRVIKNNARGRALQETVDKATKHREASRRPSNKRRQHSDIVESEEDFLLKMEVKPFLNDACKHRLVDDWTLTAKDNMLHQLPATATVNVILQQFTTTYKASGKKTQALAEEVADGLRAYFRSAIGTILLYRVEVPKHEDLFPQTTSEDASQAASDPESGNGSRDPCDVYGVDHLLRLLSKLPELLAHTTIETKALQRLNSCLNDLCKHLSKNMKQYAEDEERTKPSDDYLKRVDKVSF